MCEHCVLLPSNKNASSVINNYCKATVTKVAIDAEPLGLILLSIDSFLVNWTHAVVIYECAKLTCYLSAYQRIKNVTYQSFRVSFLILV